MKSLIQTSKTVLIALVVVLGVTFAQAAWDAPSGTPSASNNAPTPINVSNSQQDKAGKFTASVVGADSLCLTGAGCLTEWPGGVGGTTNLQNRVTGTCSIGQSIIEINEDGSVVCGQDKILSFSYKNDNTSLANTGNITEIKKGISSLQQTNDWFTVTFDVPMDDINYNPVCNVAALTEMMSNTANYSTYSEIVIKPEFYNKTVNSFRIYNPGLISSAGCVIMP